MCGRYLLTAPPEAVRSWFDYGEAEDFPPRFNIAPSQPILLVCMIGDRRSARLARWGLMPSWARDPSRIGLLFNARSETAAERPAFRGAMRHRRCLVPASGFYEWRRGAGGRKEPFLVRRADGGLLAFAGLWETWSDPRGGEIDTAAILTGAAVGRVAAIHERMPLMVARDAFDGWLDHTVTPARALERLRLVADAELEIVPVSDRVNAARFDDPSLVEPAGPAFDPTSPSPSDWPEPPPAQGRLFP